MWQDRWFAFGVRPGTVSASVAAWLGALLSSLCCLLPLAIIVLGLGSGAFMAVTMRYRWLLIPAGVTGVPTRFVLYVRARGPVYALACPSAGGTANPPRLFVFVLRFAPPLCPA